MMEFATLDKMIMELEKEKESHVKIMDERIGEIKKGIEKMKDEYRKETMPEATGMVQYLLERAKRRLGDDVIEASDIPEDLMDDCYCITERQADTSRVVLAWKCKYSYERGIFVEAKVSWLFFTDKEVYLWDDEYKQNWCVYPYKSFISVRTSGKTEVVCDDTAKEHGFDLKRFLEECEKGEREKGEQLARLFMDLKEYASRE